MKSKPCEIMAPAGSFESLQAAIQGGADAVYFGIEQLNMRARAANNFCDDDLDEVVQRAHNNGLRAYLALNTVMFDHDQSVVYHVLDRCRQSGVDAVIASDPAVFSAARERGISVHLSTQANISNLESLRFHAPFADVAVLARELSLTQVAGICKGITDKDIRGPGGELMKVEIFVHGALCMAVSGMCYLSLHTYNASANRGACNQNCRHAYIVKDKDDGHELELYNDYIMSPKDLCTIHFLDQIMAAGVGVLKIEGRGRSPEYVKTVTACYREARDAVLAGSFDDDAISRWMKRLEKVYNRGFWTGFYLGRKMTDWQAGYGSHATTRKRFLGRGQKYFEKAGIAGFIMETGQLKVGDKILVTGPTTGVVEHTVSELMYEDKRVETVEKGQHFTTPFPVKIRPSDRLFVVSAVQ